MSAQYYGILRVFQRGNLRTIESGQDFMCDDVIEKEGKTLSDDMTQVIKNKEAISAAEVSCKGEFMTGTWMIE